MLSYTNLILFLSFALTSAIPDCDSSRPNSWADHRTLYVPSNLFSDEREDDSWANALCCVYTHVEVTNNGGNRARFQIYDGSSYSISGDSFVDIAEEALSDICGMGMGSTDCNRRRDCVVGTGIYDTPAPVPAPTPAPVPDPTPAPVSEPLSLPTDSTVTDFTTCFPGDAKVQVKGVGLINISDLKVGQQVLSKDHSYNTVYSFGHYNSDVKVTNYLSLKTKESTLRLSKNHMVFIDNDTSVPAGTLKVGDAILLSNGATSEIASINKKHARGAFAPFTSSGSIVVNGIVASNYISFADNSSDGFIQIWGIKTPISFQWFAHSSQFLHRSICNFNIDICKTMESYDDEGISIWVKEPLHLAQFLFTNNGNSDLWLQVEVFFKTLIILCSVFVFVLFGAIEMVINSSPFVTFIIGAAASTCIAYFVKIFKFRSAFHKNHYLKYNIFHKSNI